MIALEEGLREEYDIVIVTVLWGPPEITEGVVDKLKGVRDRYNKPIIICSPGGEFTRRMTKLFKEKDMPVFFTPESAARAAAVLAGVRYKLQKLSRNRPRLGLHFLSAR